MEIGVVALSVYDCQSARDFFASVREAARDADRISREAAKRHGVRPRLFSLAAFLR